MVVDYYRLEGIHPWVETYSDTQFMQAWISDFPGIFFLFQDENPVAQSL